jgi:hypothetical protein
LRGERKNKNKFVAIERKEKKGKRRNKKKEKSEKEGNRKKRNKENTKNFKDCNAKWKREIEESQRGLLKNIKRPKKEQDKIKF